MNLFDMIGEFFKAMFCMVFHGKHHKVYQGHFNNKHECSSCNHNWYS